jgi:hypothetical protein
MFDLNIEFSGLCMFVPEPDAATASKVHVLLIAPDQSHPGAPTHHPRLFFDSAYTLATPTMLSDGRSCVALNDKVLDLSKFIPAGPIIFKLDHVPNISSFQPAPENGKVSPEYFTDMAEGLGARITIPAGVASDADRTGPWGMRGVVATDQELAFMVKWTIRDVNVAELAWELEGLNECKGHKLPMLRPVTNSSTGRPEINLRIVNVPHVEVKDFQPPIGDPPPFGTPSAHFGCHYHALQNPKRLHSPLFIGDGPSTAGSGTSFSCMPAQGEK